MTIEVHLGWWMLPAAVSVACVVLAFRTPADERWPASPNPAMALIRALWLIPALLAWVIFLLCTRDA